MSHHRKRLPGTPAASMGWTGVGGVRLAGDAWGDPQGPLVMLLHGAGQTRHAWGGTGKLLAHAGYRAVAYDARGHGDSDWAPDGNYGREAMIGDLQIVIAASGSGMPALVGASMGGATSLVAVGEGHVKASALILVDIAPSTEPAGVDKIRAFMRRDGAGFASLEDVADAISSYRPHQKRTRNLASLAKNLRHGADGRYYWHWDPKLMERTLEPAERRIESARRLALPTLLVRGGNSDVISEQGAAEFLALCPHSEFVNVVGAGHMVAGDRNDAFGRAALEFLQRKLPTATTAS